MTTRINTMNSEASSLSRPQLDLMDDPLAPKRARAAFTRTIFRSADFLLNFLREMWARVPQVRVRQNRRRLRVCETVPLGEKRFVAVIQVDDKQFLVGGALNSVSLLAQLDKPAEFSSVLHSRIAEVNV
ncbi:MAG: flagellar biosynthetic protein FliO [Terriglobales bacterium]